MTHLYVLEQPHAPLVRRSEHARVPHACLSEYETEGNALGPRRAKELLVKPITRDDKVPATWHRWEVGEEGHW